DHAAQRLALAPDVLPVLGSVGVARTRSRVRKMHLFDTENFASHRHCGPWTAGRARQPRRERVSGSRSCRLMPGSRASHAREYEALTMTRRCLLKKNYNEMNQA